ncbi:hypothetical protein [Nonomuraea aridisoli]|uniref:Lipoprotein n=1 Tax=Nonomuraea aridisoli TaxID=2070368 RepID=A0A2W2E3M8_9ACTN|nr:hypothetical protein [Nonomuraea aridisoli]PZG18866.1 hypothetical protein C1J01_13715 [Nonomuraea aridisoli]
MRLPLIVLASALAVTGCAPDTGSPARAAERFHAAVTAGQTQAACAMLAPVTAEKLPDPGESCADALRALRFGPGGRVTEVSVWGEDAQVRLAGDTLFLHRFGDGWRIRAAGCTPVRDLPYDCEVED